MTCCLRWTEPSDATAIFARCASSEVSGGCSSGLSLGTNDKSRSSKYRSQESEEIDDVASITQALQFVDTGAAELGFVALSQVVDQKGGSRWLVPEADHDPIVQQAVLLKTGAANPAAKAFLAFLKGPQGRAIIERYGYATH